MKIQFSDKLEYQKEAIDSIVNVFEGQEAAQDNFTVTVQGAQVGLFENELGIGNRLDITTEEIQENINKIQMENALPKTNFTEKPLNLSVEMETGERVIIVTGCINVLVSRVSGTLDKYISCIA